MRHFATQAIACLLCFCSCNNSHDELTDLSSNEDLFPIQFSIDLQKEVLPFRSTKSIPDLDISEPSTNNPSETDLSTPPEEDQSLYKQIDYLVYTKSSPRKLVKHKQFKIGDPDFSIIYDSLPRGSYQFCFLAHSDANIAIQGETAEFQKISDTFHLYQLQTIEAGEKLVKDVSLKRIVSKIEFVATDTVTNNLKSFAIDVTGFQKKIDLTTGLGISEGETYSSTYSFKTEDYGKLNFTHSFYTFVPANDSRLSANLKATNLQGENTRTRTIAEIQAQQNRTIRYSGHLYLPPKSNDTFTIDIINGGTWDETINNPLAD